MNLLLIEADADQVRLWQALLSRQNHEVDIAFDGRIGQSLAQHRQYDGIIVHLPGATEWAQALRERENVTPILLLNSLLAPVQTKKLKRIPWIDRMDLPWHTDEVIGRIQFLVDRQHVSAKQA